MSTQVALPAEIVCFLVILLHFSFCLLESYLYPKPFGQKIFAAIPGANTAAAIKFALNQGLYNLALALLLIVGLANADRLLIETTLIQIVVLGAAGAITVNPAIFFVQAIPAAIALALI